MRVDIHRLDTIIEIHRERVQDQTPMAGLAAAADERRHLQVAGQVPDTRCTDFRSVRLRPITVGRRPLNEQRLPFESQSTAHN
jgi:hypothetical protein